jgi:hypothetical protein
MILRLVAAYQHRAAATCISSHNDVLFHVCDQPHPLPVCRRTGPAQDVDLAVTNPQSRTIQLVAIDKCLFTDADHTRCDCALICDDEIQFVEFKHGNSKRRTDRVKECISQLAATITAFHSRQIIPDNCTVRAIACVGFTEQRPPRDASTAAQTLLLNRLTPDSVVVELEITDETAFH